MGDLLVQLSDSEESITKLEQYLDALGRARVRLSLIEIEQAG